MTRAGVLQIPDILRTAADPLGIRAGTARVLQRSRDVTIRPQALEQLANMLRTAPPEPEEPVHTPQRVLFLDAVNFCFWAEQGQPKWQVTYPSGRTTDGWAALDAAFSRAEAEGIPLTDPAWILSASDRELAAVFAGDDAPIPLPETRCDQLRQTARVLQQRYGGSVAQFLAQTGSDAAGILTTLTSAFPSFADTSPWSGEIIPFYKRAQICVYDWAVVSRVPLTELGALTVFADYKLPQLLREFGVLVYSGRLGKLVDSYTLIPRNSPEEVEIRAATVWAGELLARALDVTAAEVDFRLWHAAGTLPLPRPYHRTYTTAY